MGLENVQALRLRSETEVLKTGCSSNELALCSILKGEFALRAEKV